VLVVNAATVLHLNPTAAECAYHFIKGTEPKMAAREISSRYRVGRGTALADFQDFSARVRTLIATPDLDPVMYLDFDRLAPHEASLTAPLRLDCALTYRLPPGSSPEYAPSKRVERELGADEWKTVLESAWQFGIPHVTFTGGEATLRDDLIELIAHAEAIGQVCGLLTDGLKLRDRTFLDAMLQSGLDHLLILLDPDRPESWDSVEAVVPEDIFVTVHITIAPKNLDAASQHMDRLAKLGIKALSLSFSDPAVSSVGLLNHAAELGLSLKHDLPVPYSADNPVSRELSTEAPPTGAGKAWLYVEPDGDVLPAQGLPERVLGNVLRDPWDKIYIPV
jgi:hypothetical protein